MKSMSELEFTTKFTENQTETQIIVTLKPQPKPRQTVFSSDAISIFTDSNFVAFEF
jgi:hypothetical protein